MERVDVWLEWAGGTLSAGTKEENPRSWISQLWPHKLTQTAALNCRQGIHPIISSLKGGGVLKPKDKDNDNVDENDDVDELADLDDAVGDADGDEVPGPAGPEEEAVGGGHPHPQVDRVGAAHQAGGGSARCCSALCTKHYGARCCTALSLLLLYLGLVEEEVAGAGEGGGGRGGRGTLPGGQDSS